jgi:hypothetical protein
VKRSPLPSAGSADGASIPAALARLLQCLSEEGDALIGADVDRLAQAVRDKELALQRLAAELGHADRPALRAALRRARDLNERNARLLTPHLHMNRARIESLLGAARTGALYSPDGRAADARPLQRGVRA